VKDIVKREIECTAQIIDWDYIYATINTDLEKYKPQPDPLQRRGSTVNGKQ
jgi:hypothetical protein